MIRLVQRKLIIPRGDTGSFSLPVLAAVSQADIAVFFIYDERAQKTIFEKSIAVSGDVLTVEFTHDETAAFLPGHYVWDVTFYTNPQYDEEDKLIGGDSVDSYYATYHLPECEIR